MECCKKGHPRTASNTHLIRHCSTGYVYRLCRRCRSARESARRLVWKVKQHRAFYYSHQDYPL